MAYVIMRVEKIKGGLRNLAKVRNHNHPDRRELLQNREHPERQKFNKFLELDGKTLHEIGKELIKKNKELTGRKTRKDAVLFLDILTTVSPELESEVLKDVGAWYRKNLEWIKENFPTCVICQVSIELDESTIHIHWKLAATDEKGKLNAKKVAGNRDDYERRQQTYEDKMRELFPNIEQRTKKKERSKDDPRRKHKSVRQYWAEEDQRLQTEHEKKMQELKEIEEKERTRIKEDVFSDKKTTTARIDEINLADDILL